MICVPSSERTRTLAKLHAIPLTSIDASPELDLTVDGADEFDLKLRLIKGGGGALLREKIVAMASKRMIVIADSSKSVAVLGKFPLPVEVNVFGLEATKRMILARRAGLRLRWRGPPAENSWRPRFRQRQWALYRGLLLRRHSPPGRSGGPARRHSRRRRTWALHWDCQGRDQRRSGRHRDSWPTRLTPAGWSCILHRGLRRFRLAHSN